ATAILRCRWRAAVRVLVPEVPSPQRGMTGEGARAFAREKRLRLGDEEVAVPVAHRTIGNAVVRDHAKACGRRLLAECPFRNEVRSAHVAGEEGRDDPELVAPSRIRDGDETRQRALGYRGRHRL